VHVDAVRLVLGTAFLVAASVQDWRTRNIDDRLWVAMGSGGLALLVAEGLAHGLPWEHYLILAPAAILFYATFYGQELLTEEGWHFRPFRVALFAAAAAVLALEGYRLLGTPYAHTFYRDLAIPGMILVSLGLYYTGLLHGGADVKALMAITLVAPTYPSLGGLPVIQFDPRLLDTLDVLYPFPLAVLTNAALAFVAAPVALLAYNARRGGVRLPHALFGYRVPVDRVPRFVWLMECVVGGERRLVLSARRAPDREAGLSALRALGATDVWVMPQIPFIIPMAAGFVLGFLVGNVLFGILQWLLPG
jgi:preflagellin peptidase FlaK